jgi:hypothetical protein
LATNKSGIRIPITADASGLNRGLGEAERGLNRFGKAADKSHRNLGRYAKGAAALAAGLISIGKAKSAISTTEDLAKTTLSLHNNLGLATKTASEWASVASVRGVQGKQLNQAFGTLAKNAEAAAAGGKKQAAAFKALGVTQDDLKKGSKDFHFLINQVADGFGKQEAGSKKAATGMALMGKGWQTVLPVMRDGSKSMNEQLRTAEKFGAYIDGHHIKSMEDLIKAQREFQYASLGLKISFTELVAPALAKGTHAAADFIHVLRDPHLTSDQKWQRVSKMLNGLVNTISQAFSQALPKLAEGAAAAAPKVASAFINGFMHTNAWGKLAIGAFLLKKLGVFSTLGSLAAKKFLTSFLAGEAAAGGVGAAGAGAGAGLGARILRGPIGRAGGVLAVGALADSALNHASTPKSGAFGLPTSGGHLMRSLGFGSKGMGASHPGFLGFGDGEQAMRKFGDTAEKAMKQLARLGNAGGLKELANIARHYATEFPKSSDALTKFAHSADRMASDLANKPVKSIKELRERAVDASLQIYQHWDADTTRAKNAMGENIGAMLRTLKASMKAGTISTRDGLKEIVHQVTEKTGATRDITASNFRAAIGIIREQIKGKGPKITKEGLSEINGLFKKYLALYGITGKDANSYLGIATHNHGINPYQSGTRGTGPKAVGGWIGAPGMAGGDNIPIMVGAGEAVLNRHQQGPVELALNSTFGIGLDDLFEKIDRPHYMAKGGFTRRFAKGGAVGNLGAMVRTASVIDAHHYPYKWGGGHNGSFSGPYDCSGAVSAVLHAGGDLSAPMVASQFMHYGLPGPGKVTIFASPSHTYMRIGGRYFGTSGSNPGGGAGWFPGSPRPGFVVRHAPVVGGDGTINAPKLTGPNSPVKALIGRGLNRVAGAANSTLNKVLMASTAGGQAGGGDVGDVASGPWRQTLKSIASKRHWSARDWLSIISAESSFDPNARNGQYYGFGQLSAEAQRKYNGGPGASPAQEIVAMAGYIADRYRNPSRALSFRRAHNWYAKGGRVGGIKLRARNGKKPYAKSKHPRGSRSQQNFTFGKNPKGPKNSQTTVVLGPGSGLGGNLGGRPIIIQVAPGGVAPSFGDAVNDNTDATNQQNELLQQQNELLAQQLQNTQQLLNTSQAQYEPLKAALAAMVSGQIGGKVGLGFQSPSAPGRVASY